MKKQEENFLYDIIRKLLLTRREVENSYGEKIEIKSIFEEIVDEILEDFKVDKNILDELQSEFAKYFNKNKKNIIKKIEKSLINDTIRHIRTLSPYDFKYMIRESNILKEVIRQEIIQQVNIILNQSEIKELIMDFIKKDMPFLSEKIRDGNFEVKINT